MARELSFRGKTLGIVGFGRIGQALGKIAKAIGMHVIAFDVYHIPGIEVRTRITMIICLCLLFAGRASAQWVVSDPGNLAQGIINASKNIIHTSKTATNMVSNLSLIHIS